MKKIPGDRNSPNSFVGSESEQSDDELIFRYKRPFDLAVLIIGHMFLSPLLALFWLGIPVAIWLEDRGPVLFKQVRAGKGGREFTVYKFRTMVPDADVKGSHWTSDNDSRVTWVGSLLRRTGLDELPQTINLFRGEMSFVGPRALPRQTHDEAVRTESRFKQRLRTTPGLAGLAQVYLPRYPSHRARLKYDLLYIKRATLLLDIRLLVWAAWYLLTGRWGKGKLGAGRSQG